MQLYGSYTSPYVRHCRVALAQSNLEYEFIETDYTMSASQSPTAKVPYLADGSLSLNDSSSILKYIREKSGESFLQDIRDYDNFAMATTVLDACINLFLIENDGFGPAEIAYLQRQKNRVDSGIKELNRRIDPAQGINSDGALRCACFVGWALFRKRIDISGLDNLIGLMEAANRVPAFASTAPPG